MGENTHPEAWCVPPHGTQSVGNLATGLEGVLKSVW